VRTAPSLLTLAVGAVAGVVVAAPSAWAHVEPDPPAVEAGTRATIAFTVEHGCDGSPTVEVRFQLPDGVTNLEPHAPEGWTGTESGQGLTFAGTPLDAEEESVFGIAMTLPAQPATLYFPVVQTCEQGEIAWIAIPEAGAEEPEFPAPALLVTDGPPTPEELAGTAEEEPEPAPDTSAADTTVATTPTTLAEATTTAAAAATTTTTVAEATTTEAPATTAAVTTTSESGEAAPATDGDDDGAPVGLIIAGAVVVAALVGGGVYFVRRRSPQS
jgi:periplasmic copper chaperone A